MFIASVGIDNYKLHIALILAVGFTFASILGYLAQRAKFSPILGYLLAGFLIGPYSPGFVVDLHTSEQLAEIGVILMMFGVGLHFKWQELYNVKNIAIPGAFGQTFMATLVSVIFVLAIGWSLEAGLVIGFSIGVASTVVMVRCLADNHLLNRHEGHLAIGWLIVEDLITVIVLLLLPSLSTSLTGEALTVQSFLTTVTLALLKCFILVLIMFSFGIKVVSALLFQVAKTRSQELFTLAILALIFGIAIGSTFLFGTSIALGAFIAGMVIGQTEVSHQASANALPIKDAFSVIFFLSVGMLFNSGAIFENFTLFIGGLFIILVVKPLSAYGIVKMLRGSTKTGLVAAVALAQIGEFSFILSEEALKLNILPDEGYDIIVACALISIALNPFLFKLIPYLKDRFHISADPQLLHEDLSKSKNAVIIGFGPIGQAVAQTAEELGFTPIIVDSNVETIAKLKSEKKQALYGDASLQHIQEALYIKSAPIMVITIPEIASAISSIKIAKRLNPDIRILARANYLADKVRLEELGVEVICSEEETKHAFIKALPPFEPSVI